MSDQTAHRSAWVDLVDPTAAELDAALEANVRLVEPTREMLLEPVRDSTERRPFLREESTGDGSNYVVGLLLAPSESGDQDEPIEFHEVDVIITPTQMITVRKTGPRGHAYDCTGTQLFSVRVGDPPGLALWHLVDDIAEGYLDIIEQLDDRIGDLEDAVEDGQTDHIRLHIARIRRMLLHTRRNVSPLRDATRNVLDDRVELAGQQLFPRDVESRFAQTYDKLLRVTDELDLARDLLAGVRDYHQAEIANEQNAVMKRLTIVASILLLPTFIVGLYGQNLKGAPEFGWAHGYWFSWALIIATTIGQLVYFKRRRWF